MTVPGINPGSRYPKPTPVRRAARSLRPIAGGFLLLFALGLFTWGLVLPALAVAFVAGFMEAR